MKPFPPFSVMTPYGLGTCFALDPDGSDLEWATWNERTQELWCFRNPYIRRRVNASNALQGYSPFTRLNRVHLRHIRRYIENGWLPADYDPGNTETWPL